MKKGFFSIVVVAVVALGLFGWFKSNYNGMVEGEEPARSSQSESEGTLQPEGQTVWASFHV